MPKNISDAMMICQILIDIFIPNVVTILRHICNSKGYLYGTKYKISKNSTDLVKSKRIILYKVKQSAEL